MAVHDELEPDQYPSLSPADVGQLLGVHPETIRRMIRRGELHAFRVAGQLRVRQCDVDAMAFGAPITGARTEREPSHVPRRRRTGRPPERGSLAALEAIEREEGAA